MRHFLGRCRRKRRANYTVFLSFLHDCDRGKNKKGYRRHACISTGERGVDDVFLSLVPHMRSAPRVQQTSQCGERKEDEENGGTWQCQSIGATRLCSWMDMERVRTNILLDEWTDWSG